MVVGIVNIAGLNQLQQIRMNDMTFDDFWSAYPKRKGSNPKHPASLKFATAVKNGADPAHLVSSARQYAEELEQQGKNDSEFVCMASTWLNQKRWMSYAPDKGERLAKIDADMAQRGYKWVEKTSETGKLEARWEKIDASPH
jgi:hypothetical protein